MNKLPFKLIVVIALSVLFACSNEERSPVSIESTDLSECKSFSKSGSLIAETPDSLSCIEYTFNKTEGILTIKHINAGFNCCPEDIVVTITLKNDSLYIGEQESAGMCNCDCLYDLTYQINNLEAAIYQVIIQEPYNNENDNISFEINLKTKPSGKICVTRNYYPWGMS